MFEDCCEDVEFVAVSWVVHGCFFGGRGLYGFERRTKGKKKMGMLSPVWAVVFACNLPDVDMTGCCFYTVMLAVVSSPGMYIHSSFVTAVTVNV